MRSAESPAAPPQASALPTDAGEQRVPPSADRRAALALSLVDRVGPVTYRRWALADGGADASLARRVGVAQRERALDAADVALANAHRAGIALLLLGDADYPTSLTQLPDPPPALWALGDVALLAPERVRVGIVGTRSATTYGLRVAEALGRAASSAGVIVVSGMARGIDAATHEGALRERGGTIAVLGSGADVPYPRTERGLHARIVRDGLVLSELPPGTAPSAGAFPRRNRIVAAISRATVVVEAGPKSGALITAGVALDLGRDVGAVPGAVDVAQAAGSNALLRDGAAVIAEPRDLLALVGVEAGYVGRGPGLADEPPGMDDAGRRIWAALAEPARDLDELSARAHLDVRACAAAVGALEALGRLRTAFDGSIARG
ncbi:DNA protecting protein DprA [Gemmatirosa kalamazoonensis]|uniref:DNA protecting protein DprA n=1 Tax=Gemmatirosa kalamazoonensis TaxID=861299 RepID=W0RNH8_9BACT|nr:DNA-processing protein DprA [Gemmatirosa kalamazoonensis]AHG91008.1 DNA protecting protein DprA [Gemmatirosa kalamazoonensis]